MNVSHSMSLRTRVLGLIVCVLTTMGSSCVSELNTGATKTAFNIATQSSSDDTKNHPSNVSFSVNASCKAGQQLLGGGYLLTNNDNRHGTLVAIEGNYPSAPDTWTVQARNPDANGYAGDADVVVMSVAYCLTTANYDLGLEFASHSESISQAVGATTDVQARCSETTALVLSGGFKTTSLPTYAENTLGFWPGLLGTGITSSLQLNPDPGHTSMGWHVTQQYVPITNATAPHPDVSTTVYAVCAHRNINNQAAESITLNGAPTGSTLSPLCGQGEFAVGGGYDGAKTLQVAEGSSVVPNITGSSANQSPFALGGWDLAAATGGASITANAWCIRIPQI